MSWWNWLVRVTKICPSFADTLRYRKAQTQTSEMTGVTAVFVVVVCSTDVSHAWLKAAILIEVAGYTCLHDVRLVTESASDRSPILA